MTDNNETDNITKTSFEGVITDVHTVDKTSSAGKLYTRVTFAASDAAGNTMTFNTFGNVVQRVASRQLVMGDKVKLTYEVVQTTWNGKSHVFNNVCELLEVKNDNMTCACATNQIRSELEMVINMLKSICDKLAKSCEKSEDITQISKNDDELPF